MPSQDIINYAIIALMIIIIIHLIFKKNESFSNKTRPSYGTEYNFIDPIRLTKSSNYCPLKKNDEDNNIYLQKFLLGEQEKCPKPAKSTKQFHDEFFAFRDATQWNSSMREDSVDKVLKLYLDGNTSEARRYPNMKIKDLFDEATKGPNLYERRCVRLPQYDNINPDGYFQNYGTPGTWLTRDNWTYGNERIMNGGQIENGLYANDPTWNRSLSVPY